MYMCIIVDEGMWPYVLRTHAMAHLRKSEDRCWGQLSFHSVNSGDWMQALRFSDNHETISLCILKGNICRKKFSSLIKYVENPFLKSIRSSLKDPTQPSHDTFLLFCQELLVRKDVFRKPNQECWWLDKGLKGPENQQSPFLTQLRYGSAHTQALQRQEKKQVLEGRHCSLWGFPHQNCTHLPEAKTEGIWSFISPHTPVSL